MRVRWLLVGFLILLPEKALFGADRALGVGVVAAGNCKFRASSVSLNFGSLDPTLGRDVNVSTALTFKCTKGSSWSVTDDGGLHDVPAGACRMRHSTLAAFLPYRLTFANATGTSRGAEIIETLTVDGFIRGADLVDANQGNYTDTVTVTINP